MIEKYPNAWDFKNSDKELVSSSKKYRVEYGELREVGMGAPIGYSVDVDPCTGDIDPLV